MQTWSGRLNSGQYQRLAQTNSSWASAYGSGESGTGSCQSIAVAEPTEEYPKEQPQLSQQPQIAVQAEPRQLVSEITISDKKVECRGHGKTCIDIEYEAFDDTFLFEFFTLRGRIVALQPGEKLNMRYGENRKGLKVPKSQHPDRPSLGYYVLATRNPITAEAVANFLAHDCDGKSVATRGQLDQLAEFVSQPELQWQAIHLNNHRGQISRF